MPLLEFIPPLGAPSAESDLKEPTLLKRHMSGRAPLVLGLLGLGAVLVLAIVGLASSGQEEVQLPPTAEEVQAVVASMSN